MSHKVEIEGKEVEVFTAEEVQARETAAGTAAKTAAEGEWKPKVESTTKERDDARKALSERSAEFKQFRELSKDQEAALSEKDRIIYENQKALEAGRKAGIEADKKIHDSTITSQIRSRVGTDTKLFDEVKKMYELIGIDDSTEEGIKTRVQASLGALGQTAPDLLATAGLTAGGNFQPPAQGGDEKKTFADSEGGKGLANELGLKTEYTAEERKALGIK